MYGILKPETKKDHDRDIGKGSHHYITLAPAAYSRPSPVSAREGRPYRRRR